MIRTKIKSQSTDEIHYDCFAIKRNNIPSHWPTPIGDAIQNLRSSLDHAVYAAAKGKGRTQFPIFEDPCEFQVIGRRDIGTVPPAIRTIIEQAQPFKTIIGRPSSDALAVLADLSNFEQHIRHYDSHLLHIGIPWLGTSNAEGLRFTDSAEGEPSATDKETKVFSFSIPRAKADKMQMYPEFAYEVRIERVRRDRKTIERVGLITTLENIAARVGSVLAACEGRAPLPVWLIRRPLAARFFMPATGRISLCRPLPRRDSCLSRAFSRGSRARA